MANHESQTTTDKQPSDRRDYGTKDNPMTRDELRQSGGVGSGESNNKPTAPIFDAIKRRGRDR